MCNKIIGEFEKITSDIICYKIVAYNYNNMYKTKSKVGVYKYFASTFIGCNPFNAEQPQKSRNVYYKKNKLVKRAPTSLGITSFITLEDAIMYKFFPHTAEISFKLIRCKIPRGAKVRFAVSSNILHYISTSIINLEDIEELKIT